MKTPSRMAMGLVLAIHDVAVFFDRAALQGGTNIYWLLFEANPTKDGTAGRRFIEDSTHRLLDGSRSLKIRFSV